MSILFTSVMFLPPPPLPSRSVTFTGGFPVAFLQRFSATMAWELSLSSVACCNATLTILSLSLQSGGGRGQ